MYMFKFWRANPADFSLALSALSLRGQVPCSLRQGIRFERIGGLLDLAGIGSMAIGPCLYQLSHNALCPRFARSTRVGPHGLTFRVFLPRGPSL